MAILVDDAIWPWRGRKWAHLISDSDPNELHDFAHRLGMPYLAFQGDHYDIHTQLRDQAVAAGARAVTGRVLVTALRDAGLRTRGGIEPWRWEWQKVTSPDEAARLADEHEAGLDDDLSLVAAAGPLTVGRAVRSTESVLVVSTPTPIAVATGLVMLDESTSIHRSVGERGTYVEWRRQRGDRHAGGPLTTAAPSE